MSKSITSFFKPTTDMLNSDKQRISQDAPTLDSQSIKSSRQSHSKEKQNLSDEIPREIKPGYEYVFLGKYLGRN